MTAIPHEPLRAAWHRVAAEKQTISGKELALLWGVTEGAVSQYLNGHTPLNVEAQLRFAQYLDLPVASIWPDFPFRDLCPGALPPSAVEVALNWLLCDEPQQEAFAQLIRSAAKPRKA